MTTSDAEDRVRNEILQAICAGGTKQHATCTVNLNMQRTCNMQHACTIQHWQSAFAQRRHVSVYYIVWGSPNPRGGICVFDGLTCIFPNSVRVAPMRRAPQRAGAGGCAQSRRTPKTYGDPRRPAAIVMGSALWRAHSRAEQSCIASASECGV
jgi:hypothetical protein